ncbi:MAG: ATP-binding cassette domain-containing protein [Thermoprotei archaeon]|jgi:ABC-2 type transport system ATP-binding protein
MNKIAIEIQDLTKYYGKNLAVDHISLKIYENEIFGLLGPNGAGKTTTILMLATVIKPSDGTAVIGGYDIRKQPEKVRELIGIAFQDPKVYWVNTPWEVLYWHAKVCGYRGEEAKNIVRDILEKLDLWDSRNKKAFELSGGQRKKIEVGKVLIKRPKIAIFDEPTAQIDVTGKHFIWSTIRELRETGSTIILATNDLFEADILSDRVAIIYKGKIVTSGTPSQLKDTVPSGDIIELKIENNIDSKLLDEIRFDEKISKISYSNKILRIYLNRGEEFLPQLISFLNNRGIKILSATIREPTLDDVFLYYTGETLVEASVGER